MVGLVDEYMHDWWNKNRMDGIGVELVWCRIHPIWLIVMILLMNRKYVDVVNANQTSASCRMSSSFQERIRVNDFNNYEE